MIGYWFVVLYLTKLQYSDGRVETVQTPVEYDVGTVVTVVKKEDGSYVVTVAEWWQQIRCNTQTEGRRLSICLRRSLSVTCRGYSPERWRGCGAEGEPYRHWDGAR